MIDFYPRLQKRTRVGEKDGFDETTPTRCWRKELEEQKQKLQSKVVDYSDSFTIPKMFEELDSGKYGSVTKEIEELIARRRHLDDILHAADPELSYKCLQVEMNLIQGNHQSTSLAVIDVEDGQDATSTQPLQFVPGLLLLPPTEPVVILDSDDEEPNREKPSLPFKEVVLPVCLINVVYLIMKILDFETFLYHEIMCLLKLSPKNHLGEIEP